MGNMGICRPKTMENMLVGETKQWVLTEFLDSPSLKLQNNWRSKELTKKAI